MIAKHGDSVWGQPKAGALKELGAQISDRDQNVRSAALNALVEVHRLIGDKERVKNQIEVFWWRKIQFGVLDPLKGLQSKSYWSARRKRRVLPKRAYKTRRKWHYTGWNKASG